MIRSILRGFGLGLVLALVLAACSQDDQTRPTPDGSGGSGGEGGTGGSGGSGGGDPQPGPSWDDVETVTRAEWNTVGYSALWKKGRFGPEGTPGYIAAEFGIAAFAEDGTPIWRMESKGGAPFTEQIVDMHAVDLGGKADHVIATAADGSAFLLDGEDGRIVWMRHLEYRFPEFYDLALYGDDEEPLFFSPLTTAVHYVRTGAIAFRHELPDPLISTSLPRGDGQSPLIVFGIDLGPRRPAEKHDIFAFDTSGEVVFSANSERYVTELTWGPVGEDGAPVLLVGTNDARVVAFSSDGTHLWTRELGENEDNWATYVELMRVGDVDNDGELEIVVSLKTVGKDGAVLLSLSPDGTVKFRRNLTYGLLALEWTVTTASPRIVLALESGEVATLDARTGDDLRSTGLKNVRGLEKAHDPSRVFVGTLDGRTYLVDETGAVDHAFYGCNPVLFAVPGADDGLLVGTPWGVLTSLGEGNSPRWTRHFDPKERTFLSEAHFYEDEEGGLIAVAGIALEGSPHGFHFLSEDGKHLGSISTSRRPTAFDLVDLDGEGPRELVTIHPSLTSNTCSLVAYDRASGKNLWETELPECHSVWLHPGDVDGDGRPEIAVTGAMNGYQPFVALVDADGSLLWQQRFLYTPYWALALPEGVAIGGAGEDGHGFVAFHDAKAGEKLWETRIPAWRNPENPLDSRYNFSGYATAIVDQTGDGYPEIALTSSAGQVHLLDGKSGSILWSQWIREELGPEDIGGGPLAFVPATAQTPAYLVATELSDVPALTQAVIFDLEGNRRGAVTTQGGVASVIPRRTASGEWRVALAERYGTRVVAVAPKKK